MYTETDLRKMLQVSADRADDLLPALSGLSEDSTVLEIRPPRRHPRRRMIAPIAVAACTAAVVGGVVTQTQRPDRGPTTPGANPTVYTVPDVAPYISPKPTTAPYSARPAVPVVDDVRINTLNDSENIVTTDGAQTIVSQLGTDRTVSLVIAPSAAFNDSKIARMQPVTIAGTIGYYAVFSLYPLSAGGEGGSDPAGTVVFRTANRSWAFASLQSGTSNQTQQGSPVNDPSAIVRAFDTLHASFAVGTFRTPLQVGYLPGHTTITRADNFTSNSRLTGADISAHSTVANSPEIDISITHPQRADGPDDDRSLCFPNGDCTARRHRNLPGGFVLEVQGSHYSEAETQKVIDHITVATNLLDRSSYFILTEPGR